MARTAQQILIDATHDEYRDCPAYSQSDLKAAFEDAQLWHDINVSKDIAKQGPSPAQQWGSEFESVLRSGPTGAVQLIPPEVLTSNGHRRGKKWEEYRDENADKILVTEAEYFDKHYGLERAYHNVKEHHVARSLVFRDSAEWHVRILWDAGTGLQLKGELDILDRKSGFIVDVKTTACNTPDAFQKDVFKWGYDIQAAAYLEAASILLDTDYMRYFWVVVQNKAPWRVEVYQASIDCLLYGFRRLDVRREWFKQCLSSGVWRSPTFNGIVPIEVPRYLKRGTNGSE